ncbi:MAG: sugar ABC transporter permease [Spirochaetales bacterium]|nr:sugar ABC transporter permease [Spirochaetales bacterium]
MKKKRVRRENQTALTYLAPALIFLIVFMVYPLIYSGILSFFKWTGVSAKVFIGFENFQRLFTDNYFWRALVNNISVAVSALIFQVFIALVIAFVLVRVMDKVSKVYLFIFLIPMVVSEICIGLLWGFIYNPYFGLINAALRGLGLESLAIGWLGESATAFPAVINAMNFTYLGLYVLLFVNSIQDVPEDIFDAAKIDGAGGIRTFFNVVIPVIRESIGSTMLLAVISSFKTFSLVFVLTNGGPNHRSEVLSTYLYKMGFNSFQMGYASTIGFVQMLLMALAGFIVLYSTSRKNKELA